MSEELKTAEVSNEKKKKSCKEIAADAASKAKNGAKKIFQKKNGENILI